MRVPVKNLSALCGPSKQIDVATLQESLGWAFLRTDVDGHWVDDEALACQRGFQLVRPEEVWFPGKSIALFNVLFPILPTRGRAPFEMSHTRILAESDPGKAIWSK